MVNLRGVVGVAQLVERRSVAPDVAGSIPVSHPKNQRPAVRKSSNNLKYLAAIRSTQAEFAVRS